MRALLKPVPAQMRFRVPGLGDKGLGFRGLGYRIYGSRV